MTLADCWCNYHVTKEIICNSDSWIDFEKKLFEDPIILIGFVKVFQIGNTLQH